MQTSQTRTILIVDDEALFRKSLAQGLAEDHPEWRILTAENGLSARSVLEGDAVDLVLTDLAMPHSDGFELLAYMVENRPWIPALVFSAFGTDEIATRLAGLGFDGLLEKPVDFDSLLERISAAFESSASGFMRGISLPTFLQILELDRKSCRLEVSAGGRSGVLDIVEGTLYDAEAGALSGEEAAAEIVCWEGVELEVSKLAKVPVRRIETSVREVILESFRRRDERRAGRHKDASLSSKATLRGGPQSAKPLRIERKGNRMSIQEKLKELAAVDGFTGAGLFTPGGESLAVYSPGGTFTKEIGVLANNVLQNAQRASLEMGTGRGEQVHVQAEHAHILVRCLNEGSDPLKSETGKAHIHLVLALASGDAIGLAKMRINTVIEKLAPECRG